MVTGGKGLGKTRLVDSVLSQYGGKLVWVTYFRGTLSVLYLLSTPPTVGRVRRGQGLDYRQGATGEYEYSLTTVRSLCRYGSSFVVSRVSRQSTRRLSSEYQSVRGASRVLVSPLQ